MRLKLDETALDLFARRPTRSFSTGLAFVDAPTIGQGGRAAGYRPRQVVELCGPADAPKTEVLLHVIAAFVTRNSGDQQPKERVVLFDHECDVSEEALEEALARVQVCHCRDSFQWLATLNHVHFKLLEAASAPLMLAFNCVGSFQAIDKMTAKSVGDGLALSEQVFVFLKEVVRLHSPIVFATKETAKNPRAPWEHAEYLPSSWTAQVSKRILLRRLRQSLQSDKLDTQSYVDSGESDRFEARCIVGGESRVFSCFVDRDRIISAPRKTECKDG